MTPTRVDRLTGHDAAFLYLETPTHFHHGLGLLILDPSTMSGGYTFEKIRSWLIARIAEVPTFTEIAFDPWYNLGYPVWAADESFDIDRHLHHYRVPDPGGPDELRRVCDEIASTPLDLGAPLWEFTVIDGLADGSVALMTKYHNAGLDGVHGNSQMGQLCGNDAAEHAIVRHAPPADPVKIALSGLKAFVSRPFRLAAVLIRASIKTMGGKNPTLPEGVPKAFTAPRTSFNTVLTNRRNIAFATLPLQDALSIKKRLGVTLNDLSLALTASALRSYLSDRGELPAESLQAFVPMSVHHEPESHGRNQTTGLLTNLQTQLTDPYQRAMAISEKTKLAKAHSMELGAGSMHDLFEFAAPYWGRVFRWYSKRRFADRHAVMQSLVVSNIGGRHPELYFAGARVTRFYPFGAPLDGAALFITVATLDDQLNIGLISCPEIIPDLTGIADHFQPALAELADAIELRADTPPNEVAG
jgi:diacylglycerol O-acyltransferase / wax synthase